ncbi:MAG: S41 family peptidase, partial [Chloroflexota bacterium]
GVALVAAALVAVLVGSALFLSGWTLGRQATTQPGTPVGEAEAFQPFWDAYHAVSDRYAGGTVDQKKLIEGAIKGMIGALDDPYSMYMTSDEFKQSLQGLSGQFEGIGATIGTVDAAGANSTCDTLGTDCRLAVVAPIADSPAAKAGLVAGDVITAIDGAKLDGLKVDEARGRIRGPKDSVVTLTIVRAGGAPRDIPITRAVIITPEVTTRVLGDGAVGYIELSGFSEHAATEMATAVSDNVKAGRKALILDLRGNPGGFVTAARSIASQFLADGTVFWEEDAAGNLTETAATSGGLATDPSIKLIVLVDGGSASASEIVAGALHDRGRAQLVGTKTFGKGTVQQWTQLESDSGGFRLTIAKWLTPDKTWVHKVGITPDVVVDTPPAKPGDDPILAKALELLGVPSTGVITFRAAA